MYAQVVFDLPLEKFFDYSIPLELQSKIFIGSCVKVSFGTKKTLGIVIKIVDKSQVEGLKPIKSIEKSPILDCHQIHLAQWLSTYYGCSTGQALFTILRGSQGQILGKPALSRMKLRSTFYCAPSKAHEAILETLIKPYIEKNQRVLVIVPDQFAASGFKIFIKKYPNNVIIGTRSAVFRSFMDISLVIMMDEHNISYKQEQTPMYETRNVLLERLNIEHFQLNFVSSVASIEMKELINQGKVIFKELLDQNKIKTQVIDLNNYKVLLKGILSPAILSVLEQQVNQGLRSMLVFNHRGSFCMTRCTKCGFVLQCEHCASAMTYSRTKKSYLCRYCTFQLSQEVNCPACKTSQWKFFGLGIEQLQKILKEKIPHAKIEIFEKGMDAPVQESDILIGTIALLRFKHQMKPHTVALLDVDSDLNRLDIQSCFRTFAMALEFKGMAQKQFFIQSRNLNHYCIEALNKDDSSIFYKQDMQIRRELKIAPYGHQVLIQLRDKQEKLVEQTAKSLYELLFQEKGKEIVVHKPMVETISKKRDSYRMNILLQGAHVADMISLVNWVKQSLKRNKVIITLNVDS